MRIPRISRPQKRLSPIEEMERRNLSYRRRLRRGMTPGIHDRPVEKREEKK